MFRRLLIPLAIIATSLAIAPGVAYAVYPPYNCTNEYTDGGHTWGIACANMGSPGGWYRAKVKCSATGNTWHLGPKVFTVNVYSRASCGLGYGEITDANWDHSGVY